MNKEAKSLLAMLAVVAGGAAAGVVIASFVLGTLGGNVACGDADASYFPLPPCAGVFAYATSVDTLVVTTANTYYPLPNTFANAPVQDFTFVSGPPAGIRYDGTLTRYFEIDWHSAAAGDANGITVKFGIAINGTTPETSSIMGTFLKISNEIQALSGTAIVQLAPNDVVTLVATADHDLDEIAIHHYTTSIRPFFVEE